MNYKRIPTEIWEIIFDYVQLENKFSSASDLQNCSRACIKFARILEGNKCTWIFKNILPCIFQELERTTILHLRLVCKSWKNAVDHFLQNYQHYFNEINRNRHINISALKRSVEKEFHPLGDLEWLTTFSNSNELDQFLKATNHPTFNPFPGASLCISYDCSPNDTFDKIESDKQSMHFYSLIIELLCRYGDNIFYLKIYDGFNSCLSSNFGKWLYDCLQYLPNLKRLYLNVIFEYFNDVKRDNEEINLQELKSQIECLEIAHNNINRIALAGVQEHLHPMFHQLTRLQLSLCSEVVYMDVLHFDDKIKIELPYVQDLELKLAFPEHLDFLKRITSATKSNLKKFTLLICTIERSRLRCKCRKSRHIPPPTPVLLQEILDCFVGQIKDLENLNIFCLMRISLRFIDKPINLRPLLHLSSLKCLQLYGFVFRKCGILNSLPISLEYLHLHCDTYRYRLTTSSSEILIGGHECSFPKELDDSHDKYYYCELWKKLPKLKCISLRTIRWGEEEEENKVFWRSTWEWKQRKLMEDNISQKNCCNLQ